MARYFFPAWDGTASLTDEIGVELVNDDAAREMGLRALSEMAADRLPALGREALVCLRVRRQTGETIASFELCWK
jgi:hypothetical protein